MKKRVLSLVLAMALACSLLPAASFAAGDTMDDATPISFGETVEGEIAEENREDWYEVTLPSAGTLFLELDGTIQYIYCTICDSDGKEVFSNGFLANSNSGHVKVDDYWILTAGTYYVKLARGYYNGSYRHGTYSFSVDFEKIEETFPEPGTGADNTMDTAHEIKFGETYQGLIPYNNFDDKDWYKVTLPTAGGLCLKLDGTIKQIYCKICDSDGKEVRSKGYVADSNSGRVKEDSAWLLTAGTYYVEFEKYYYNGRYASGSYSFSVDFEGAEETFPEPGAGADNTMDTANEIKFGKTYQGLIPYNNFNDKDWYKVTLPSAGVLSLKLGGTIKQIYCKICDSDGKEMWGKGYLADSDSNRIKADISKELTEGTYYIEFEKYYYNGNSYCGTYEFSVSLGEPEPETVTVTLKTNNGSSDKKVTVNKGETMSIPDNPTRKGYVFDGWYTDEKLTKSWKFSTKVEKDMTLYAGWEEETVEPETVTVTLKANNGSSDKKVTVNKGETMTVPTNPTQEGSTFGGWYTDEKCTKAWNFNTKVDKDMTLYAKWTVVSSSATETGKSSQSITVDGKKVTLDAYTLAADSNGGDVTYVKLRDVAEVLNGTKAQFNVEWLNGAIYVATQTPYTTKNGTELKSITLKDSSFKWNTAPILFGGVTQPLEGIVLTDVDNGGHTFFKLRDLGAAIGFHVDWSAERGIYIETK